MSKNLVEILRAPHSAPVRVAVLCALAVLPLGAQGRGGGPPPPPPLPPTPVTVVNPAAADCYSGAGCLDPTFGTLGKAQHDISGDWQYMYRMAIQPDGKIVTAGGRWTNMPTPNTWDQSWVIGRFLVDGTIDTSFGTGGLFTLDLIPGYSHEQPVGVAVQADGKIVVGGYSIIGGGGATSSTVIIRLSASGVLDPTFGSGGKVERTVANGSAGAMVLQPDGKIVMVRNEGSLGARVTRFKTNGDVDKTFGSQGSRLVSQMTTHGVGLQSTGRIVLAGVKSSVGDAMLARLTASGALDTSFGSSGSTVVDFSGLSDAFLGVAIAPDDSIVAGGHVYFVTHINSMHMAIGRFTSNGALAAGFGNSGRVVLDMHGLSDSVRAVTVGADGRVEFAGWGGFAGSGSAPRNAIVGRLTTTGALDSSFGSGGVTETSFGVTAYPLAAAVGPDGLLTVAGNILDVAGVGAQYWMLARYFR